VIMPASGAVDLLSAAGITQALRADPVTMTITCLSLATGADVSTRVRLKNGPDLIMVKSGSSSFAASGAEAMLSPGATAFIQPNIESVIRKFGLRPAVLLMWTVSSGPFNEPVSRGRVRADR
jgi:hypothetical protein